MRQNPGHNIDPKDCRRVSRLLSHVYDAPALFGVIAITPSTAADIVARFSIPDGTYTVQTAGGRDGSGCWIWTGETVAGKNGRRYGCVNWGTGPRRFRGLVHRFAYAVFHGTTLADLVDLDVHHACGNTLCSNPAHLYAVKSEEHGRRHRLAQLARDLGYESYAQAEESASIDYDDAPPED